MPFSPAGLTFFLASITAAYGWDRVWERPEGESRWVRPVIWAVTLAAAIAGGLALTRMAMAAMEMSALLAAVTIGYPWLKRLPLMKNLLVSLVWVMAATFFPFIPEHGALGWWFENWLSWDATIPLFILWVAACLLCDLKDEEEDRASGVRSIPALYGTRRACFIAAGLTLCAAGIAVTAGRPGLVLACLVMLALTCCPVLLKRPALGPLLVDTTLAIPGALVFLL